MQKRQKTGIYASFFHHNQFGCHGCDTPVIRYSYYFCAQKWGWHIAKSPIAQRRADHSPATAFAWQTRNSCIAPVASKQKNRSMTRYNTFYNKNVIGVLYAEIVQQSQRFFSIQSYRLCESRKLPCKSINKTIETFSCAIKTASASNSRSRSSLLTAVRSRCWNPEPSWHAQVHMWQTSSR